MAFVLPLELECREKLYGHPTFLLYSDVLLQFQNNFYSLAWYSNTGIVSSLNPLTVFAKNGIIYTANVSDSCGNIISESIAIDYNCPFIIPNIITPNNDGINDVFKLPIDGHVGSVDLYVYNRWGNIVYQMINYDNTWNPNNLNDGTYFYIINAVNEQYKGYLTIKK